MEKCPNCGAQMLNSSNGHFVCPVCGAVVESGITSHSYSRARSKTLIVREPPPSLVKHRELIQFSQREVLGLEYEVDELPMPRTCKEVCKGVLAWLGEVFEGGVLARRKAPQELRHVVNGIVRMGLLQPSRRRCWLAGITASICTLRLIPTQLPPQGCDGDELEQAFMRGLRDGIDMLYYYQLLFRFEMPQVFTSCGFTQAQTRTLLYNIVYRIVSRASGQTRFNIPKFKLHVCNLLKLVQHTSAGLDKAIDLCIDALFS